MSTASKPLETHRRRSSDPVSWYLATIGRIPLLTPAEEIELGNQVQAMMALTEDGSREFEDGELTTAQRRLLRIGCLLYTSPSPRDGLLSRMPSSA